MILFEWDALKERRNKSKHGVSFEDAMQVFDDPFALSEQDRTEGGQRRWQMIGLAGGAAVLLVAHTVQGEGQNEIIRIISARLATRKERNRYEENLAQNAGR
jgi:hypothetical protein